MKDMDYVVGESNVDTLFPIVSKLTVDDLLRGIRFDFSDENNRIEQFAKDYFRTFVTDVYEGKICELSFTKIKFTQLSFGLFIF